LALTVKGIKIKRYADCRIGGVVYGTKTKGNLKGWVLPRGQIWNRSSILPRRSGEMEKEGSAVGTKVATK